MCWFDPACSGGGGTEDCTNGIDDDGNGLVDCDDFACLFDPACSGGGGSDCVNGIDDDGNGFVDCRISHVGLMRLAKKIVRMGLMMVVMVLSIVRMSCALLMQLVKKIVRMG